MKHKLIVEDMGVNLLTPQLLSEQQLPGRVIGFAVRVATEGRVAANRKST